ncbi:MAG: EAL domain-containing protein [Treponema sp.]
MFNSDSTVKNKGQNEFSVRKPGILLVEKNDGKESLKDKISQKYQVTAVSDPDDALEILKKEVQVSVIIIDMDISFSKATELIKDVRSDSNFHKIPVIAVTSSCDKSAEEACLELGVSDIARRPLSSKLLDLKISNIIQMTEISVALNELEYDDLTGLYTRQAFIRKAREFIDSDISKEYAILGVDFENFKFTNAQYGEEKCNEFLAYIGKSLLAKITDGFAGRFAGDQFVMVINYVESIDLEFIQNFAKSILDGAPIPHQIPKIGIYAPIDKKMPIGRCCDKAFLAIREIKGVYGQDIVFYTEAFQEQLAADQRILDSMEHALLNEEFCVYYQPKHESVTGKIAGAEALVRWIHPEYGFMSPGQFIPLFEKNGFITKLDSFVLLQVCKDIKKWENCGIPLVPISVNISRRDCLEPDWIDRQLEIIDSFGINHSLIHMEVTESLYAESMDVIIEQIKKIKDNGFLIEMDDFGSGYSSLGTLATFPLDVIKLDISFVKHIEINEIVIENIIKMVHRLGFITVAEGAETEEQFKTLRSLGCDLIQGYCFSKPLPRPSFELYLKENSVLADQRKKAIKLQTEKSSQFAGNENIIKATTEIGESLPGGFFTYHADGNHEIISFNQELLKIYGCRDTEEFRNHTGNSFDGMVHPDDLENVKDDIITQVEEGNNIVFVEYRIFRKDGQMRYIQYYGRMVKSEKYGNIFYAFINDITDEHIKFAEEEKRSEVIQGLSQSFNSIFLIDFKTNTLTPYASCSRFEKSAGANFYAEKTYDQIAEFFVSRFVVPEERDTMRKLFSSQNILNEFKTSSLCRFTFHKLNENNSANLVEISIRKLNDESGELRAVLTLQTVSENALILQEVSALKKAIDFLQSSVDNILQTSDNSLATKELSKFSEEKEHLEEMLGTIIETLKT